MSLKADAPELATEPLKIKRTTKRRLRKFSVDSDTNTFDAAINELLKRQDY